jgi:arylformamidase
LKLYRDFTTQAEIDAEYNLEAVLDMQPYIEWFLSGSAKAREELECRLDVRFGPTLDETVDVFPARRPGSPILVFIHGGWWRFLSSKEFSLVARGPVARDVTVVVTNYSLCPKVSIAEITRQSRAAIAWVHAHAVEINGDPGRIFVAGHSAGGHQVGMLAITDWPGEYGLPADVLKGGVPISGVFDLRPFPYSWLQPKLLLDHQTIERQSPLFHVPADGRLLPLLVTLGGEESAEFHRQSATFVEAWRAAGGDARTFDQPGKDHITAIAGFEDPESALCRAVLDFMERAR